MEIFGRLLATLMPRRFAAWFFDRYTLPRWLAPHVFGRLLGGSTTWKREK